MALQDRQRDVAGVAIAVVEGQRRERRAACGKPAGGLGERHEFETARGDARQRGVEELRRHFEQPVRREAGVARHGRTRCSARMKPTPGAAIARCRPVARIAAKPAPITVRFKDKAISPSGLRIARPSLRLVILRPLDSTAMTPAADRVAFVEARRAELARVAESRPFAQVECRDDLDAVRSVIAELAGFGGAYQSFDFLAPWAKAFRARLAVVVARNEAGRPVALLPLHVRRFGPLRVAAFAGDAWANFHLGLFRPGPVWRRRGRRGAAARGRRLRRRRPVCAVAPAGELGRPRQPASPARCRAQPQLGLRERAAGLASEWLDAHFSRATQKKQRKKARKLEAYGAVRMCARRARPRPRGYLDALSRHKAPQARARGEADEFACPKVRDLLRRLVDGDGRDGDARAGRRRTRRRRVRRACRAAAGSPASSSPTTREVAAASPGEWLLIEVVRDAIARGLSTFDLGVGQSRYKEEICEQEIALYDGAFAATPLGRLARRLAAAPAARASAG